MTFKKTRKRRDPGELQPVVARIAGCLHDLRVKGNHSQEDIAKVVGVTQAALSRWENPEHPATPSAAELAGLAEYFAVSLDYIVGHSEFTTSLPAGEALVDQGLLDALAQAKTKKQLADLINFDLGFGVWASIPAAAEVVSHQEVQNRVRAVDKHLRSIDHDLWQEWARHVLG